MILDNAGDLVWWHSTKPRTALNLRAALWKGRPVLTWWEGKSNQGLGEGECVIADEHYDEIARFRAGHRPVDLHEFVITPRGTALVTSTEIRRHDLTRLGGRVRGRVIDSLIEELEIPSGRVLFEWRSLDHVAPDETHATLGPRFDYFHANSIAPMADGSLLVSARNTWALYKVARPSGRVIWRLGGKRSDFHMGHGTHFYWQHDARSHDRDRLITVFDDGAAPPEEKQSRGLFLAVDERRRRVTLERAYTHQPPLLAKFTGSTQLLHDRNVLVGWGSEPYFTEFGHDGTIRLDMQFAPGGESYRALRFPWSGQPKTTPTLVAVPNAGSPLLYVSWNGATEVASWQLLTGSTPAALQATATVPRTGFETQLSPGLTSGYAAVTALDASDRPLGQSATVTLS
jgi:Arylsulfotransferase (ASST)